MLPELLSVMSWEEFISFFQYPFVWRAVVVGTLIALVAALLGVTLVLKRFSFIGDGLSHVACSGRWRSPPSRGSPTR